MTQVETFLTEFGTRPAATEFSAQAQDLLTDTRLLLDSKRVVDPRTRKLLEDLELVLAQIATLDPARKEPGPRSDRRWFGAESSPNPSPECNSGGVGHSSVRSMHMSAVRYLVLALCAASVSSTACAGHHPESPGDGSGPRPHLARPRVGRCPGAGRVALAQVRPTLADLGPAMAAARAGLRHAQAALAGTSARMGHFGSFGFAFADDEIAESPPAAWAQQYPADQIYRDARRELNRGRFATAADLFAGIYKKYPRSTYAGDAYYWQAYALSKRDNDESLRQALSVLKLQKEKAEGASSRRDAEQLRIRICGELAKRGDADCAAEINEMAREAMVAVAIPTTPRAAAAPRPPRDRPGTGPPRALRQ